MTVPLLKMPETGELVKIDTTGSQVDWIMLEISSSDIVRYTQVLFGNVKTEITIPAGVYRFNYHYQRIAGPAIFKSKVTTPHRVPTYPDNSAIGNGGAPTGEYGLTAYRVEV